jgi:predicted transcriptional regulator of viral defense system
MSSVMPVRPRPPRARRRRSVAEPVALHGQQRRLLQALQARQQQTVDLKLDEAWLRDITAQPRKLLWRLSDKRVAHRLQGGRYLVDLAAVPRQAALVAALDPLAVFLLERLGHDHYLSWHSALWRYGLVDQQSREIQVACATHKVDAAFGAFRVRFVQVAERKFFDGRTSEERHGEPINMASLEKALIDSLDRPALAGDMATAVEALRRAHAQGRLDTDRLVQTAIQFGSPTLNRRLGFFMERYEIPGSETLLHRLGKGYAVSLQPGGQPEEEPSMVDTRWGVRLDGTLLRATDMPK